jgi:hypothetical protein
MLGTGNPVARATRSLEERGRRLLDGVADAVLRATRALGREFAEGALERASARAVDELTEGDLVQALAETTETLSAAGARGIAEQVGPAEPAESPVTIDSAVRKLGRAVVTGAEDAVRPRRLLGVLLPFGAGAAAALLLSRQSVQATRRRR